MVQALLVRWWRPRRPCADGLSNHFYTQIKDFIIIKQIFYVQYAQVLHFNGLQGLHARFPALE